MALAILSCAGCAPQSWLQRCPRPPQLPSLASWRSTWTAPGLLRWGPCSLGARRPGGPSLTLAGATAS
eukprot:11157628-Lingulodinium_polyedra.AAC.1